MNKKVITTVAMIAIQRKTMGTRKRMTLRVNRVNIFISQILEDEDQIELIKLGSE